jgi:hypothetical protein
MEEMSITKFKKGVSNLTGKVSDKVKETEEASTNNFDHPNSKFQKF